MNELRITVALAQQGQSNYADEADFSTVSKEPPYSHRELYELPRISAVTEGNGEMSTTPGQKECLREYIAALWIEMSCIRIRGSLLSFKYGN